jgi:putative Mn2+ efflux pump MntP
MREGVFAERRGGRGIVLAWESVVSALSLAMDAFAVALCLGAGGATYGAAFRMGAACGIFQFFMPLIGWLLGAYSVDYIASFDHWVAFALLVLVGGNMIRGSFSPAEFCERVDPTRTAALFYLALATSIDALAVGAGFAMADKPVWGLAIVAGTATGTLCFGGMQVGRRVGCKLGKRVELAGGALLCLIGLNILRVHVGA